MRNGELPQFLTAFDGMHSAILRRKEIGDSHAESTYKKQEVKISSPGTPKTLDFLRGILRLVQPARPDGRCLALFGNRS
jgi:hypothetical protein